MANLDSFLQKNLVDLAQQGSPRAHSVLDHLFPEGKTQTSAMVQVLKFKTQRFFQLIRTFIVVCVEVADFPQLKIQRFLFRGLSMDLAS